jgi:hypothetical protein
MLLRLSTLCDLVGRLCFSSSSAIVSEGADRGAEWHTDMCRRQVNRRERFYVVKSARRVIKGGMLLLLVNDSPAEQLPVIAKLRPLNVMGLSVFREPPYQFENYSSISLSSTSNGICIENFTCFGEFWPTLNLLLLAIVSANAVLVDLMAVLCHDVERCSQCIRAPLFDHHLYACR